MNKILVFEKFQTLCADCVFPQMEIMYNCLKINQFQSFGLKESVKTSPESSLKEKHCCADFRLACIVFHIIYIYIYISIYIYKYIYI